LHRKQLNKDAKEKIRPGSKLQSADSDSISSDGDGSTDRSSSGEDPASSSSSDSEGSGSESDSSKGWQPVARGVEPCNSNENESDSDSSCCSDGDYSGADSSDGEGSDEQHTIMYIRARNLATEETVTLAAIELLGQHMLLLHQASTVLDEDVLDIDSRKDSTSNVGGHGEGLKVACTLALKLGYEVQLLQNSEAWRFCFRNKRSKKKGDTRWVCLDCMLDARTGSKGTGFGISSSQGSLICCLQEYLPCVESARVRECEGARVFVVRPLADCSSSYHYCGYQREMCIICIKLCCHLTALHVQEALSTAQ
jgi:hypothetical protein